MRTGFLERTRSVEVTHRKEQRVGERERRKKTLDILVCWLSFSGIISALLSLSAYPPSLHLSLSPSLSLSSPSLSVAVIWRVPLSVAGLVIGATLWVLLMGTRRLRKERAREPEREGGERERERDREGEREKRPSIHLAPFSRDSFLTRAPAPTPPAPHANEDKRVFAGLRCNAPLHRGESGPSPPPPPPPPPPLHTSSHPLILSVGTAPPLELTAHLLNHPACQAEPSSHSWPRGTEPENQRMRERWMDGWMREREKDG